MKYKVGDKVRIVSKWGPKCNQNPFGRMDKYLGQVLTIKEIARNLYYVMEEDPMWVWNEFCIAGLACDNKKILVTTDGVTTTARLYAGRDVIKTAVAKCSAEDMFVFETGAALAVDRLLGRDPSTICQPEPFSADMLKTGRFGRLDNGTWFVVVKADMIYFEEPGGYDHIADLDSAGCFKSRRVDCVVDAVSLNGAKYQAGCKNFIWVRPGAKFE